DYYCAIGHSSGSYIF
nr:immunoglobulin light chain junction region [Macaca mulatta]MOW03235.1 immunoglobulin light chain junction region [Macaca mulatta]MOW03660.1 immunoglobulin light chain junction region [Macaca mulatta]MOW03699.1 immunoglobulin light chain junction region [Macaca mulatta]MOW03812.1 immunoglobulin light chain junction region [Macaca mulatta]